MSIWLSRSIKAKVCFHHPIGRGGALYRTAQVSDLGSRSSEEESPSSGEVSSPHGEGYLVTALEAKAKAKEEAKVAKVHPPVLGQDSHSIPYFLRFRQALPWWELHGSQQAVELIRWGVPAHAWIPNHLSHGVQKKSPEEVQLALQVLGEYLDVKAVRIVPPPPQLII